MKIIGVNMGSTFLICQYTITNIFTYKKELLIAVIFFIIESSVVGYIYIVLPVKSGARNKNIHYDNMMIQISDDIYRSVSYHEDIRDQLHKGGKNKSHVKQFSIKRKMNFRDPSKKDIKINNKAELKEQDEVPLKFRKFSEDIWAVVTE